MNRPWALAAIKTGSIVKENIEYNIIPNTKGSCDGCCFLSNEGKAQCYPEHPWAHEICNSNGGNILKIKQIIK